MRRRHRPALLVAAPLLALGLVAPPAQADGHVVVDGLVSPLGFALGADGTLYVSEAFIGQLTAVSPGGERTTLATAGDGGFTSGVDAVGKGTVAYTVSLPPEFGELAGDTALNRVLPNGRTSTLGSLQAHEEANNPDADALYGVLDPSMACAEAAELVVDFIGPLASPGEVYSNPYAVVWDKGGSAVVADAGGNDLVRVHANGSLSTIAVFPSVPQVLSAGALEGLIAMVNEVLEEMGMDPLPADTLADCAGETFESQPVPTDVEIGPDGHYYVSALPGFPEEPGTGVVFRVNRSTGAVSQVASGFSGAVDLAVAGDGTIYVAELFGFQVSRVDPGATSASASTFVPCPTALEIGRDGTLYVAEGGFCTGEAGRIVRLDL